MDKLLPQCFLGKTVFLGEKQTYTIKYQDNRNQQGIEVLLFDGDKPVIFALMKNDGTFIDSFFINKKANDASTAALYRYQKLSDRKAKKQATQVELKDALHNEKDARMKNENIFKLLVDEHLEDISHGWPSRLLQLQRSEFKCDDSLIIVSLKEALKQANPHKAFYFLTLHRYDDLILELTHHLSNQNNLIEKISKYYQTYSSESHLFAFLKQAAKTVTPHDIPLVQTILSSTHSIDLQQKSHLFKPVFLLIYKQVKKNTDLNTKDWLKQISKDPVVKQAIITMKNVK